MTRITPVCTPVYMSVGRSPTRSLTVAASCDPRMNIHLLCWRTHDEMTTTTMRPKTTCTLSNALLTRRNTKFWAMKWRLRISPSKDRRRVARIRMSEAACFAKEFVRINGRSIGVISKLERARESRSRYTCRACFIEKDSAEREGQSDIIKGRVGLESSGSRVPVKMHLAQQRNFSSTPEDVGASFAPSVQRDGCVREAFYNVFPVRARILSAESCCSHNVTLASSSNILRWIRSETIHTGRHTTGQPGRTAIDV